ncbi:neuroligin-4, X-linked-like [Branchiostoma floridae x Branchiostoma japonicum]
MRTFCIKTFGVLVTFLITQEEALPQNGLPTVGTTYGQIVGKRVTLSNPRLRPVIQYLGIPYARPPVGELRFRPPLRPKAWPGVYNCTTFGPVCPQADLQKKAGHLSPLPERARTMLKPFQDKMNEDCLYLNLYHPEDRDGSERYPLAVMVFIHGGGYTYGAGSAYDGSVLASLGNVVVVTINYRLGAFGFLSTGDASSPGNYGLLDQIAALQWVKDNIDRFHGDPSLVTLFGVDTGAAAVNLLMLTPNADGLFRRAILQSGSALASWALSTGGRRITNLLAEQIDCCKPNISKTVECLRKKPYQDIMSADIRMLGSQFFPIFGPVVDGDVIPDNPKNLMSGGGQFWTYDALLGVTESEGYMYISDLRNIEDGVSADGFKLLISDFVNQLFPNREAEITDAVAFIYTNWGEDTNKTRRSGLLRMFTEQQMGVPSIQTANLHSTGNTRTGTFFYTFNYRPTSSPTPDWVEAAHGEEIPFVFGAPLISDTMFKNMTFTKLESMLSTAIMTYWTNFAKTGSPNEPRKQETTFLHLRPNRYEDVLWKPYNSEIVGQEGDSYMYFGMRPRVPSGYRSQRVAFWKELVPKLLKPSQVVGNGNAYPTHSLNELCARLDVGRAILVGNEVVPTRAVGNQRNSPVTCFPTSQTPTADPSLQRPKVGFDMTWTPKWSSVDRRDRSRGYSSELSVVIAVGTSLLFVNVVVFAVCYHRKERKSKEKPGAHTQDKVRLKVSDVQEMIKMMEFQDATSLEADGNKTELVDSTTIKSSRLV